MPKGTFLDCCSQCPCTFGEPLLTHPSIGDPPTLAGRFWFSLLWGHCSFPLGLGMCKTLLVPSKTGGLFPPSPVKVLSSDLAGLQGQIPWRFPDPLSELQAGKPDVGFSTFTAVGGSAVGTSQQYFFWYCYSAVVGHAPDRYGIWFYCDCATPSHCSFFVFGCGLSFLVRPCVLSIIQQVVAILVLS